MGFDENERVDKRLSSTIRASNIEALQLLRYERVVRVRWERLKTSSERGRVIDVILNECDCEL